MSRLIRSLHDFPQALRGGALAIGNFDAVHIGHATLMRSLVEMAGLLNGPAIVFTFDPPPGAVLRPDLPAIKPLTSMTRRCELVSQLGVSALIAFPTETSFLQLTATQFFDQIIRTAIGAKGLVEGINFRFGRGREGDIALLGKLCAEHGMQMKAMELVATTAEIVSSTRVRQLVTDGQVEEANRMLLYPYRIEGEVVVGAQRGRTIGFPTANLATIPVLLPALGVYAGRMILQDQQVLPAAIHIGPNPTFEDPQPKVEVHLPGWSGSLYGQRCEVELLARVRDVRKFSSVDDLKEQLSKDVQQCVAIATSRV